MVYLSNPINFSLKLLHLIWLILVCVLLYKKIHRLLSRVYRDNKGWGDVCLENLYLAFWQDLLIFLVFALGINS